MRVGLIARGEDRGLGTLTREFARHVNVAKTLIVRPQATIDRGLAWHPDWFAEGALTLRFGGELGPRLDEDRCRAWLEDLDVVYSAETFYDWRFCDWAREARVATVCHLMPEYWKHTPNAVNRFGQLSPPDAWWNPTGWRREHLPADVEVVPVPVPLDRWPVPAARVPGPPRWLHVAGAAAHSDRNGTRIFERALRLLRGDHDVTIASQDHQYRHGKCARGVHTRSVGEVVDYWTLYEGQDAMVLPRRYGGLSLPALEALGAGLALLMPDAEPQRSEWPIVPLAASWPNHLTTSAGSFAICAVEPEEVARTMNRLGPDLAELQQASRRWAVAHSWGRCASRVEGALWRVAERGSTLRR